MWRNIRWTTRHLLETENLDSPSKGASPSYQRSNITGKLRTNTQVLQNAPTHQSIPHCPHASTWSLSHRSWALSWSWHLFLSVLPFLSLLPPGPQVHKKWTLYLTTTESKLFVLILMFCAPSELLLKTFWNFEAGWRGMLLTALVGLEKMVLFSTSKLAANLRKQDKFPSRLNQISSQNSKVII